MTRLAGTGGARALDVPGTLGTQIASAPGRSRIWLPTWHQEGGAVVATAIEVNTRSGRVTSIAAGDGLALAVVRAGSQLLVGTGDGDVRALLPSPTPVLRLAAPVRMLAVAQNTLWAIDSAGRVSLMDLRTQVAHPDIVRVPGTLGAGAAFLGGRLWVSGASLVTVDSHGSLQTIRVAGGPVSAVARCAGRIWTTQKDLGARYGNAPGLRAVDADGEVVRTIRAPFPGYVACTGRYVWTATADGRLYKLAAG
ncbi:MULTISPECIES: hypothetical protein [unclassified Nocardioides]|uniref:hypothetical protein n=1 Tax=unclassified Nocardioides TaxID=2615069 RepID=UPI000A26AC11|nr:MULTISPECIES: hypothetical protein [unclassified Nocardioides]